MQYDENNCTCNIELKSKTNGGARKLARSIAKQEKIDGYDIVYRCFDGRLGRLGDDLKRRA